MKITTNSFYHRNGRKSKWIAPATGADSDLELDGVQEDDTVLDPDFLMNLDEEELTSRKHLSHPMQKAVPVSEIETGWYEWWEKNDYFKKASAEKKFAMLLPPPNITGKLHMGHALTCALQDAIIRWKHMNGCHVVWVPGCDHAGIATQIVVEQNLSKNQGLSRHDLGRERFVEEIHKWKEESQSTINAQMKKMGVLLDWNRSFFTLDPNISQSVMEAFTRLFEAGFIYRGKYMINWCCALQSAISDFEVETLQLEGPTSLSVPGHEKQVSFGYMFDIRYRLADSDETVTVSTTRPETVLGDTALMVHPNDARHTRLHGKKVRHPFRRGELIPVVADPCVDTDKGTGVVKVTPGHSSLDFEVAKRHQLPILEIFDDRGWVVDGFEWIPSQHRFAAREAILNHLASENLLGEKKPHSMQLPTCSRSGDVMEPRLKDQWFLSTSKISKQAMTAVEEGTLTLHPGEFSKLWRHFLGVERDWCISRQLWWGHRFPIYWVSTQRESVYGCDEEVKMKASVFVAAENEEQAKCKAAKVLGVSPSSLQPPKRETDVLDTWFSSALLPFASLGWPSQTADLKSFFPLSLMVTGHDILFFWVARMVMLSLAITGRLPFHDVLLHGLVCDAKGQKMSKSKGNALDPLDIIDGTHEENANKNQTKIPAYGSDALRFALCSLEVKKNTFAIDIPFIRESYLFRNKMWQTVRFLRHNLGEIEHDEMCVQEILSERSFSSIFDRWLLSHVSKMVSDLHQGFTSYNIHQGAWAFRRLWQTVLCDVYLETVKPRLWNHSTSPSPALAALEVLYLTCHTGVVSLSPFMPFLSEELYQRLPSPRGGKEGSVLQCSYPRPDEWVKFRDCALESRMAAVLDAMSVLRNLRRSYNITSKTPQGKASLFIKCDKLRDLTREITTELQRISFLSEIQIHEYDCINSEEGSGRVLHPVCPDITVQLHLQGMINPNVEGQRLGKKLSKLQKTREEVAAKIERSEARGKTPKESDVAKVKLLEEEIKKLEDILENVMRMMET